MSQFYDAIASGRWDNISVQEAVNFAYAYGYPLHAFALAVKESAHATVNVLIHQRTLSTVDDKWVVRPNIDTLYSRAFLDLSRSDLVLEVPEFEDRFWLWPFYDLYGNNVANIGAVAGHSAGTYLVRFDPDNVGVQTENIARSYRAYINLPTPYGLCLARIIVASLVEGDTEAVRKLQDELRIEPVPRGMASEVAVPDLDLGLFTSLVHQPGPGVTLEEAVLQLTASLAPYNLPSVKKDRDWVPQVLERAGLSNGTFTQKPGTSLLQASAAAKAASDALLKQPGCLIDLGNGWTRKKTSLIGDYGSNYEARCQIAKVGYLALTTDQVVYPSYLYGQRLSLEESQALLFTFSAKPKVHRTGFWSLTAYDGEGLLIPNELGRHNLGDRSNLKYPNGDSIEGSGTADGMFQILVQPANLPPPSSWTSNWLPGPSGGGLVSISLRLYGAEDTMIDGTYIYPELTTTRAFVL